MDAQGWRASDPELEAARETNRRLNRRIQELESGVFRSEVTQDAMRAAGRAASENQFLKDWARSENRRSSATFDIAKQIFKAAAPALGLPCELFHSVSDLRGAWEVMEFDTGEKSVYAHVFVSPKGGVRSFDILGVVRAALPPPPTKLEP